MKRQEKPLHSVWEKVSRFDSSDGTVWKYVFEMDDAIAEAVLYSYPTFQKRTVLCCSTQSGCPVGCSFCGTGRRFVRNLKAGEIVYQVWSSFLDHGVRANFVEKLQIMFMSMGEPMLNFTEVSEAIRTLHSLYPSADLLISTMGPEREYRSLIDLSREISNVGLQFSVHESTDEARAALIPFKQKLSLAEIAMVGSHWAHETGRRPFFNYCAHGLNTTDTDADRLLGLFNPRTWEATVSVICEKDESVKAAHDRQRETASNFMGKLIERGFNVRLFNPAGQDDIGGGCGQLWFTQQWMRKREETRRCLSQ